MTSDFISKYESNFSNAEIAASGTAYYFTLPNDVSNKDKHGSFNYLEVMNNSDKTIYIDLDNLSTRRRILFGKSVLVIAAEDNLGFNTIKITNTDGAAVITAALINGTARIMRATLTPVIAMR